MIPTSKLTKIIFLLLPLCIAAQEITGEVKAAIDIYSEGTFTRFTATAHNTTAINKNVRFEFVVVKQTTRQDDQARTEKSGFQILAGGEKKILSQLSLNMEAEIKTIAFLLLYEEERLLAKDRIVLNGQEEESSQPLVIDKSELLETDMPQNNGQDGIVLRGMVVEDTKTKPGNDFYRAYYSRYLGNNINGEQIVTIKEDLGMGSNTKIKVVIDQEVILEFFVNPRASYIDQMADQAIMRTNRYFQDLKRNRTQQKRY